MLLFKKKTWEEDKWLQVEKSHTHRRWKQGIGWKYLVPSLSDVSALKDAVMSTS